MRADAVPVGVIGRRRLMVAGAGLLALAVSGCTTGGSAPPVPTVTGGPDDPDRTLRTEVAAAEWTLAAQYDAVLARHRGLEPAATLAPRHPAYAGAVLPASAAPTASSSASAAPKDAGAALRALLTAERAAARARLDQCARAVDPELARTLALAGAGAAGAATVLAAAVGGGNG